MNKDNTSHYLYDIEKRTVKRNPWHTFEIFNNIIYTEMPTPTGQKEYLIDGKKKSKIGKTRVRYFHGTVKSQTFLDLVKP